MSKRKPLYPRAVLYARVSGDDRSNEGRNLESQLEMCREHARSQGWQVVAELAEDDRGACGASFELKQLNRALEMARAGEFDILVVRELDRLSRRLAKQLIVEEEFKRSGVRIEYVLGDYDDTPEGGLMKNVRAVVAEYERLKIAERSSRGRRDKVKAGHVTVHGNPPFGYRVAHVDGKRTLEICEEEAEVVRQMYHWYTVGDREQGPLSVRAIVRRLSSLKIPTHADRRDDNLARAIKQRPPGEWAQTTVCRMLRSETYAGVWRYAKRSADVQGESLTVEVPAIVSHEEWEAARRRAVLNQQNSPRNLKREYLLRRRTICGQCGLRAIAHAKKPAGKAYLYYRCPASHSHGLYVNDCNAPSFNAQWLDAAVWKWVKSFLVDPEALASGLQAEQEEREQGNVPLRNRLQVVDDLITENQRRMEKLLDLFLESDFPREILGERKARLEETIAMLEREQNALVAQIETQALTDDQVKNIWEFASLVANGLEMADADFKTRRRVIELLDAWATLVVEDGEKVAHVRCILDEQVLSIVSRSS